MLISGCTEFQRSDQPAGDSVEIMLERVLGSVVTVAVEKTEEGNMLLGFRGSTAASAYKSELDLGSAVSSGSGFVIERDGEKYVITNSHVVESVSDETGSLYIYSVNRTKYEVKVIGGDTFYDFAVLAFVDEPGDEITTVKYKKEKPKIGEQVWAIGNPLGDYPYTISEGIIGGLNRVRGGPTGKFGFLQSTATVIWGNSGGPLIDRNGDVAGINSQITLLRRGQNIFIQPQINLVLEAAISERLTNDILNNNGRVRRAHIGIELTDSFQNKSDLGTTGWRKVQDNPVISFLIPNTPASRALAAHKNSRVLSINDVETRNIEEALGVFETTRPGDRLRFTLKTAEDLTEVVEFATEELNPENNLKFIERLFQFNSGGKISLDEPSEKENLLLGYGGTNWDVAGAGLQANDELSIWRVETRNDLATAARFAAMYGFVDIFVSQTGQSVQRLHINLSSSPEEVNAILWY